jgi:hypothetical protein
MTTTPLGTDSVTVMPALRRAAMRAMLAPSTHNTQPWRFVAGPRSLDLYGDPSRGLDVIDPHSRQLVISCGAALLGARLSLASEGLPVAVDLLPDPGEQNHLARIRVLDGPRRPDPGAAALDRAGDTRHTNRRPFGPGRVPEHLVASLESAAEIEGAFLRPLTPGAARSVVIGLTAAAEGELFTDPAYRSELRDWAGRRGLHDDGIPSEAIPAAGRTAQLLPVRAFDQQGTGRLPASTHAENDDCLLLLATDRDDRLSWLQAGQALERVLLEITRAGFVAGLFTQLSEIRRIREQVRSTLDLIGYPHLLLRVGQAERTPQTPRRPVPEILTETRNPVPVERIPGHRA